MAKTVVLGIGNILLQDEGFGVRVIEELLSRYSFPDDVDVLDGGTLGFELLGFITGVRRLLIVDAISGGGQPGTFYRFRGKEVQVYFKEKVSLHELGIKDVLAVLEMQGEVPDKVVVMGIEPESLELGLTMTPVAADMIEFVVQAVLKELNEWQVEVAEYA
ncbi:MAG: hydrogenase expression/formation protein [Firmicutes bacterium]|nr:hydrogenase expression/formation protein [Bacillota bacterium]